MKYRNAQTTNHGTIQCDIMHPMHGWIPYDCPPHNPRGDFDNDALYTKMSLDPVLIPFIPKPIPNSSVVLAQNIREARHNILTQRVDPIVSNPFRWNSLTTVQQSAYATYRTKLLDITLQTTFPTSVVWPPLPI